MHLIERLRSNDVLYVVDCEHAHTEFEVPHSDHDRDHERCTSRFGALIRQHKKAAHDDPDMEDCDCPTRITPQRLH